MAVGQQTSRADRLVANTGNGVFAHVIHLVQFKFRRHLLFDHEHRVPQRLSQGAQVVPVADADAYSAATGHFSSLCNTSRQSSGTATPFLAFTSAYT